MAPVAPGFVSTASGAHIKELNSQAIWVDADWVGNTNDADLTFTGSNANNLNVLVSGLAAKNLSTLTITSTATERPHDIWTGQFVMHDTVLSMGSFVNPLPVTFSDVIKINGSTVANPSPRLAANSTLLVQGGLESKGGRHW